MFEHAEPLNQSKPSAPQIIGTHLLTLAVIDFDHPFGTDITPYEERQARSLLLRGNEYFNNSSYKEAINCYEAAKEYVPDSFALWYYEGDALFQLGMYPLAIDCYEKATDLEPSFLYAWNNLAYSHYKAGSYEKAENAIAILKYRCSNLKENGLCHALCSDMELC